ncbi:polysaccharide deacetylase [Nocardioides sp.]|uniref:polysaccharide deacetylase n=1 Tax=Nocardioides sp. TaxID=35761 RepID=UPI003783A2C3
MLTFDIDAESCMLAEGRRYAQQPGLMSHQAFGPKVGVPRILRVLRAEDVRATFFVPGLTAERYPDLIRRIIDEGHEVGHHSHSHRAPLELSEGEERLDFERGMEALDRLGIRPRGHRSALWAATWETAAIAVEFGMDYESNMMDNDRPYVLETGGGTIVEVPPHWSWDDFPQYAYLWDPDVGKNVVAPSQALKVWAEELDAMREWGAALVLNAHPFLSGRASRVRAIRDLIRLARDWGDVAVLSASELADRARTDPAIERRNNDPIHVDPNVYPHE